MSLKEKSLRAAIIANCRTMNASGLNQGTSGNISARLGESMLITPSAVPYANMRPDMLARIPLDGEYGAWHGPAKPSSEWRFHLDIMRARPDVGAIVHCHPTWCTALAMLRRPIPASHYMIALFGGPDVRCTDYASYGTKELSDLAVAGLADRFGVLLGNHGAITVGPSLENAMARMVELETLARMHCVALSIGRPAILPDAEVYRIVERFKTYGGGQDAPKPGRPKAKARAAKAEKSRAKDSSTTAPKTKRPARKKSQ